VSIVLSLSRNQYGLLITQCKSNFKPEIPGLQAAKTRVFGFS